MSREVFFKFYHHLINLRLYSGDQIAQRNQTILVANWKRADLKAKEQTNAKTGTP